MTRFKKGAPLKLYAIIYQNDGSISSFSKMKERDEEGKANEQSGEIMFVKATYILERSDK